MAAGCDPGFSSLDDWKDFNNTCHVNIAAQQMFHKVGFYSAASCFVITLVLLLYKLARASTREFIASKRSSRIDRSGMLNDNRLGEAATSSRKERRSRAIILVWATVSYSLFQSFYYGVLAFFGPLGGSQPLLFDISRSLYFTFTFWPMATTLIKLLMAFLPDLRREGHLLGLNTFLLENPQFFNKHCNNVMFTYIVFPPILALAIPWLTDFRFEADMVLLSLPMFTVFALCLISIFLARECHRVILKFVEAHDRGMTLFSSTRMPKILRILTRNVSVVKRLFYVCVFLGVCMVAGFVLIVGFKLKFFYIFFNTSMILANITMTGGCIIILFCMNGLIRV